MIAAGKLRDRITIKSPPAAEQDLGELGTPQGDAATFAEVWAQVEQLGGDERAEGDRTAAIATHRITLRWLAGVTTEMSIAWEGRTLGITSAANPDGRKMDLLILAREKGAVDG